MIPNNALLIDIASPHFIKETRIPVSVILEQIAEGESWDSLLAGYPELEKGDIQAALLYASASLDHSEIRIANVA
jgi:uncharacterized protein (DUF433 family)